MCMLSTMEERFRLIVQHIFTNWAGLQMAVEQQMGGPNSRQTAIECVDYMTKLCLNESNLEVEDIKETLEDIIDEDFNTLFEDGSPLEVATLLHRFASLLKEGNCAQCELEYKNLPVVKQEWLILKKLQPSTSAQQNVVQKTPAAEAMGEPMEQDEWTEVKVRRKR